MAPELEEVRAWILRADHDRLAAKLGLQQSPPLSDIAAFHAQQAVEKLLEAFLVFKGVQFKKVHDLAQLTDDCGKLEERSCRSKQVSRRCPLMPYVSVTLALPVRQSEK